MLSHHPMTDMDSPEFLSSRIYEVSHIIGKRGCRKAVCISFVLHLFSRRAIENFMRMPGMSWGVPAQNRQKAAIA